ncbi:MAG: hypothetical protein JWO05_3162 [Gemmatimonadetes bacterium]|nr:hypothetical protein [Gemmatimonadota bacterium]
MKHNEEHPTRNEDEYFARENADLVRNLRSQLDSARKEIQKADWHMKCPKCGGKLAERPFAHVMADVCEDCHGVWLDAGEVDLFAHVSDNRAHRFFADLFDSLRPDQAK